MIGRNITGERFGSLVAIEELKERSKRGKVQYLCECDCGNVCTVDATNLRTGKTKSCGCQSWRKKYKSLSLKNKDDMRLYKIWYDMKRRCADNRRDDYYRYGGRGISVCNEWQDFQAFYDWSMGNGYDPGLTIDRIDNNGNYCPENCRWTTNIVQANNKRNNHMLTHNGETKTMAEWSRELGISYSTIRRRQALGWSDEKTLTAPVKEVMA